MARWLAGELTEAERVAFEASSEYAEYLRLAEGLKAFKKPNYDKEALREKVWQGIESQKPTKVLRFKPLFYTIGIAASLLLLFGLFFNQVTYTTGIGEKLLVELPDGTSVNLNAKSKLSHNRFFWENNKEVDLDGEAFFKVTKGADFTVQTEKGRVGVLGTEFNVRVRPNTFELYCYEGKVRYENKEGQQASTLVAGDAVSLKDNILLEFRHTDNGPSWQTGKSTFSNAELYVVLHELEIQYGISFSYEAQVVQGHFTGTFLHDNLELALKSVFVPMGIDYKVADDQKTVILNAE